MNTNNLFILIPVAYILSLVYMYFYFKESKIGFNKHRHIFRSYIFLTVSIIVYPFLEKNGLGFLIPVSFTLAILANFCFLYAMHDIFDIHFKAKRPYMISFVFIPIIVFSILYFLGVPEFVRVLLSTGMSFIVFVLVLKVLLEGHDKNNIPFTVSPLVLFTMLYALISFTGFVSTAIQNATYTGIGDDQFELFTYMCSNLIRVSLVFGYSLMVQKLMFTKQTNLYSNKLLQFDYFKHQSEIDHLSQLYNRNKMEAIARQFEEDNIPYAVLYLDIDGFKLINDTYGHNTGDTVIKSIANCLKETFRDTDAVGRWCGDEFLVIVQQTDPVHIQSIINKTKQNIAQICVNGTISLSVSIGTATTDGENPFEQVVKQADVLLYNEKAQYAKTNK